MTSATIKGITCPVERPLVDQARCDALGKPTGVHGIAVGRVEMDGQRCFTIVLRHPDGAMLSAILSPDVFDKFATALSIEVEAESKDLLADRRATLQ